MSAGSAAHPGSAPGQDRMAAQLIDVPPGLAGVVAAETVLGDVRDLEGFYHYRQYSAVELARPASFEDVWCLMLDGALPDATDRAGFVAEVARRPPGPRRGTGRTAGHRRRGRRRCAGRTARALPLVMAADGTPPLYDQPAAERRRTAIRIGAVTPVLLDRPAPARPRSGSDRAPRRPRPHGRLPVDADRTGGRRTPAAGPSMPI